MRERTHCTENIFHSDVLCCFSRANAVSLDESAPRRSRRSRRGVKDKGARRQGIDIEGETPRGVRFI